MNATLVHVDQPQLRDQLYISLLPHLPSLPNIKDGITFAIWTVSILDYCTILTFMFDSDVLVTKAFMAL